MNLLFNPYVRELYPSWYAIAWPVLLVVGSAPGSYASSLSNKTSGDEAQLPSVSFDVHDTLQLSDKLRHSLSVAAYDDNSSSNAARGPGTGIWGVGIDVFCRPTYNYALVNTSEFDKVASAVASTIMVLVPALLSFAPLPTASIRTLLYFNIEAALCSAAMTLGLYNKSLSTLRSIAVLKVKDFCDERTISLYGTYYLTLRLPWGFLGFVVLTLAAIQLPEERYQPSMAPPQKGDHRLPMPVPLEERYQSSMAPLPKGDHRLPMLIPPKEGYQLPMVASVWEEEIRIPVNAPAHPLHLPNLPKLRSSGTEY